MSFKCSLQKIHKDPKNDYFFGKDLQKPSFYFKEQSPKIKFNIRNFFGASNMGKLFFWLGHVANFCSSLKNHSTLLYCTVHPNPQKKDGDRSKGKGRLVCLEGGKEFNKFVLQTDETRRDVRSLIYSNWAMVIGQHLNG